MLTSEVMIAFITGVLGPVLLLVVKNIIEKKKLKKPDMVLDALEVGKLVESKIEDIKDEFKPDRVWITQFHNGGHFYPTGKSIAKFSVMYETVGTGVSSIQQNFQNIPVNLFSKSLNNLANPNIATIGMHNSKMTCIELTARNLL